MKTVNLALIEDNATDTIAHGYSIIHTFQLQEDNLTRNAGQYVHSVTVDSWEYVAGAVARMLEAPEGDGYTLSIEVTAL